MVITIMNIYVCETCRTQTIININFPTNQNTKELNNRKHTASSPSPPPVMDLPRRSLERRARMQNRLTKNRDKTKISKTKQLDTNIHRDCLSATKRGGGRKREERELSSPKPAHNRKPKTNEFIGAPKLSQNSPY
jgi:hypothetical protein